MVSADTAFSSVSTVWLVALRDAEPGSARLTASVLHIRFIFHPSPILSLRTLYREHQFPGQGLMVSCAYLLLSFHTQEYPYAPVQNAALCA